MPRKPRQGYTPSTLEKRTIQLPADVSQKFRKECLGEYKDDWLGAAVLWMATKEFPLLRDRIRTSSRTLVADQAVKEVRGYLAEAVTAELLLRYVESLSDDARGKLLLEAHKAGALK